MKKIIKNKLHWIALAAVLLIGGGFIYYQSQKNAASSAITAESEVKTAVVRKGDLTISASGSGTLIAGKSADLSFPVSGTVAELNVKVGESVTEGQVLAVLSSIDQLQAVVTSRQIDLLQAQQTLDDLTENASLNLGLAKQTLAQAQEDYQDAKDNIKTSSMRRCDDDTSDEYYDQYYSYQLQISKLEDIKDGYGLDYYLQLIQPLQEESDKAYVNWQYCSGYTEAEILESQANVEVTSAALDQAQRDYDAIVAANGIDPDDLALANANLENAQIQLKLAQQDLDEATMVAPFDGVVISIAAEQGEKVGTSTYISIADLENPDVEVYVDESDMDNFAVGYQAEVVFDALPSRTFTGVVSQVDPELQTISGYNVIQGEIKLDTVSLGSGQQLSLGMNASVDIIGGEAKDALLVPVEALRDLGDGQYSLFVLENGEPKLHIVEVGLMDYTYAQILSGVNEGDVVTTGIVQTN